MDRTDPKRLQQIQQSDLTESRINQDFMEWLKTKGMNWALLVLIVLCALMGWNLWKERRAMHRNTAWVDLASASIPASLQDVAARFPDVDAVAPLALLSSADRYLVSIQTGQRFDREPSAEDYRLTPEVRTEWLAEADRLYSELLETARRRSRDLDMTSFMLSGLFGRAAIAESRGDASAARGFIEEARGVAEKAGLTQFVTVADERLNTLAQVETAPPLPTQAQLPGRESAPLVEPPVIDENLLRELLTPSGGGAILPGGAPTGDGTSSDTSTEG